MTQHALFFSKSHSLFCIIGFEGSFRQVNGAFIERLGYEESVLLQKQVMDLIHAQDRQHVQNWLDKCHDQAEQTSISSVSARLLHGDGRYREYLLEATPSLIEFAVYLIAVEINRFRSQVEQQAIQLQHDDYQILQERYDDLELLYNDKTADEDHIDYTSFLNQVQDGVVVRYPNKQIKMLNPDRVQQIFAEAIDAQQFNSLWQRAIQNPEQFVPHTLYRVGKKQLHLLLWGRTLYKDDTDKVYAEILVIQNFSEQHEAESHLKHLQSDMSLMSQTKHEVFLDWDLRKQRCKYSKSWGKLLGISQDTLGSDISGWHKRIHPADYRALKNALDIYVKNPPEHDFEHTHRLQHQDGFYRWMRVEGNMVKNTQSHHFFLSFSDVTKQHQLEETLSEVNEHHKQLSFQHYEYETIFNTAPISIIYKDSDSRILRLNAHAARWIGKSQAELIGLSERDLFLGFSEQYYEDDIEVIKTGQPKSGVVEKSREHYFLTDKVPYQDHDGNTIGVIVFARDITRRIQAEQQCTERENQVHQLLLQMPVMAIAFHDNLSLALWNHHCVRVTGYTEKQMLSSTPALSILYTPSELQRLTEQLQRLMMGEIRAIKINTVVRCQDGTMKKVRWTLIHQRQHTNKQIYRIWGVGNVLAS